MFNVYILVCDDTSSVLKDLPLNLQWLVDSISMSYWVPTCITPFMIILGAASLLLITYKGYDRTDDVVCTIAGVFGLCICFFPCNSEYIQLDPLLGTFMMSPVASGFIHNASAVIFFLLLAYNSLFLFTKSAGEMTDAKKKRNIIFKVCGIGMLVSLSLIIPGMLLKWYGWTWFMEMIALSFFGISWLTKSQCYSWLFKD